MSRARSVLTALVVCAASVTWASSSTPAGADPSYTVGASVAAPTLGDLPVQRVFAARLPAAPTRKTVISFTVWDDAAIHAFVRAAASGTVIAYEHEPEQEIARGDYSAQSWADHAIELTRIIQDEGRVGEVLPATVLMRWTLDKRSHRSDMLATMLSPEVVSALQATGGILGWDSYAGPKSNRTPQDMYGVAADYAASRGLPWAIMETGTKRVDPDRWTETFRYLDSMPVPPRYFLAWNPSERNDGVYAIQDQPEVATIWRDAMQAHAG